MWVLFIEEGGMDARRAWTQMCILMQKEQVMGITHLQTQSGILLFIDLISSPNNLVRWVVSF